MQMLSAAIKPIVAFAQGTVGAASLHEFGDSCHRLAEGQLSETALAMLAMRALRFFLYVCYDKSRNERADFYGRFWQEQMLPQANSALHANLANPLFARFYAKSLLSQVGT